MDINLFNQNQGYHDKDYSKNICFKIPDIKEINFSIGGHGIEPEGNIKYSQKVYHLKHMNYLGLPYSIYKLKGRHLRLSQENIRNNWGTDRYTNDMGRIISLYKTALEKIGKKMEKIEDITIIEQGIQHRIDRKIKKIERIEDVFDDIKD